MSILRKNILIPAATVAVLFATTLCSRAVDLPSSPGGAFDHDNQAPWSTPGDGRLVMLARNAAGFNQPMPFRFRVCVTNFTGTNNSVNLYVWTTPGFEPTQVSPAQPQTRQLQLGECAEIGTPAAIIVQDATTSGTASGYYQLLQPTPAPPDVQPPPTTTATIPVCTNAMIQEL